MGNYATEADVQARRPTETIGSGSPHPTSAQVALWIAEAEAIIDGLLASMDITVPVTASRGILVLRSGAVTYCELRWRSGDALEKTIDDRTSEQCAKEWEDFKAMLTRDPITTQRILNVGSLVGDGKGVFRSHVIDNSHDKSVSNGDFDPKFTKDMES